MRRALPLLLFALLALFAQGALAVWLQPPWCPDLSLLVLLGIGLRFQGLAVGLVLALLLGYASDLLSGSLFGQQALLSLTAFAATVAARRQLNLRGAFPLAVFAAVVTLLYGFGMLALTGFFTGGAPLRLRWLGDELIHAGIGGLCAPLVSSAVGWVMRVSGDPDAPRRVLEGARTAGS